MSSSSKSSTASTQNYSSTTQDNRIVADAGAITFSQSDGNTINSTDKSRTQTIYQSLDAGAVGSSFDFAEAVSKGAASASVASVGAMKDFGKDALSAVKDAYGDANGNMLDLSKTAMDNNFDLSKLAMGNFADLAGDAMSQTGTAWGKAVGAIADNTKMSLSAITSANKEANDQIRNSNADVAAAYKGVNDTLSDAWQSSKAGEQKMLAFGLLAVVGIVVAKVMGGR